MELQRTRVVNSVAAAQTVGAAERPVAGRQHRVGISRTPAGIAVAGIPFQIDARNCRSNSIAASSAAGEARCAGAQLRVFSQESAGISRGESPSRPKSSGTNAMPRHRERQSTLRWLRMVKLKMGQRHRILA